MKTTFTSNDTPKRGETRPEAAVHGSAPSRKGRREDAMSMRRQLMRITLTLGLAALFAGAASAAPRSRPADPAAPLIERILPVTSVPVVGTAVINVEELSRRNATTPDVLRPPVRPLIQNEREGEEGELEPRNESGVAQTQAFTMGQSINLASPAPTKSFAGLDDIPMADSSYIIIPPDVNGAVGPTKVFQNLNNNVRIIDKTTGAVLNTVGVNTWWAGTGATPNDYTDPHSTYDPYNNRFIAITQGDLSNATGNTICLGVSDTNDPSGTWHLYRFVAYENSTYQYADYPTLGFNKNWITISINMYNSSQTQVRRSVFMVHYPTLLTSHTATVYRADNSTSGIICGAPCVTYSATSDTEYVMQRRGTNSYSIDMITGTGPGAPTYTTGASQIRPGGAWSAPTTSNYFPQGAPVSGTSACGSTPCGIERNDDNIRSNAVFRGGSIWFSQAIALPSTSPTHMAVQWTQVTTPGGGFVTGGRLQDTLATTSNGRPHYGNPSISVNALGDFILGFTRFGSSQHPGAGYAMHIAADGVGTLRDTVVYKDGDDYYHKTFSTTTGRNRWGDFSTAQVDPSDDLTLWTVQEYAKTRPGTDDGNTGSNSSKWGTWWAGVAATSGFSITASAGTGGTITPSGTIAVAQGGNQTFNIAASACYAIADVKVDNVSQGAITTYTFTNVQASHTISATFSALGPYAIVASAGANGTVSPAGTTNVACGGSQGYTIAPAACYHVADVLVDGVSVGAVTTYNFTNVSAPHTISATFAVNGPYTITASAGANGSISPSGSVPAACGSTQAFTIAPAANYHVADVLVDGSSVGAVTGYTFNNVQASHTISATFAITTYTITASSGPNGSITPSGATVVNAGTNPSFTLSANSGFYLSSLVVDGGPVTPVPVYTFTNVQADHTIAAAYASDAAVVSAASSAVTIGPNHPCDVIPVSLVRNGTTPVLGWSVTFQLSAGLTLCSGTSSITEGSFLNASGGTLFNVIDHGGGLYTVDDALTANCGPTATTGSLFSIGVGSSATSTPDTITITSLKLRDCLNADLPAIAGQPATVPVDNLAPLVAVLSPNGAESFAVGSLQSLDWSASDASGVTGIAILLSRTGSGGSFDTLATGLANTPPWSWSVTGPATTNAFLKVVAYDPLGNIGADLSDAAFTITSTTGVGSGRPVAFSLLPLAPNPVRGSGTFRYALPRAAEVRLSIIDPQGREVAVLANGEREAGFYEASWNTESAGRVTPGVYFARYQTPGKTFVQRFVIMK